MRPVLAALLLLVPAPAPAQGSAGVVRGRLTIEERGRAPTRDLADAVVWLVPAGGAAPATGADREAAARPAEVLMQGRQFAPRVRVVSQGVPVEFVNGDPFRHNAFSNSAGGPFDLGLYGKGERRAVTPARPGVYTVHCDIHARMKAHLVVVPGALWAQPGLDGRWEIAGVAPGRYVLHAWHERGGATTREVVVTAAGAEAPALALDARGFVARAHKNKFGRDYPTRSGDRY